MAQVKISRIISRGDVVSCIYNVINSLRLSLRIEDAANNVLIGNNDIHVSSSFPITCGNEVIGWVKGDERASIVAAFLNILANAEFEKKVLAQEALSKYKELTMLYNFTERIATCRSKKEVGQLVVEEARKFIKGDNISIMLIDDELQVMEIIAASGSEVYPKIRLKAGEGIAGSVILSGKAQIINDVSSDPRYKEGKNKVSSLVCAPLKINDRVLGVINISSEEPYQYSSMDLKLFSALALQAAVSIENAIFYENLRETFITTIQTLAETVEKRDCYTGGHITRVMNYSTLIGHELGLSDEEMQRLVFAAILHDIGKIGIRDMILLKTGKLTDEEYAEIKKHPIYGEEILKPIKQLKNIIPGIKQHHERFDGSGYPEGLRKDDIDMIARIISVADTFDAMTTNRPYGYCKTFDETFKEIEQSVGTQLDPDVVAAFMRVYEKNKTLSLEA
jgi:HD-GYP domain-containing protein (c-di-GMP phosphodiesterase class II)